MSGRHAQRLVALPRGPARWMMTVVGGLSLATVDGAQPRYEQVVVVTAALVALAAGVLAAEVRPAAGRAVRAVAALFLGLAGVVAAVSFDEALTLVAGAVMVGVMTLLFTGPRGRVRHAAP